MRALVVVVILLLVADLVNAMWWHVGNKTCVSVLYATTPQRFCYYPGALPPGNGTAAGFAKYYDGSKIITLNQTYLVAQINHVVNVSGFLMPVTGKLYEPTGPAVLYGASVVAYDASRLPSTGIAFAGPALVESTATVVDANGYTPPAQTVYCADGKRELSTSATYFTTKWYIKSSGDVYLLDTTRCVKYLIATSNYATRNNTGTAILFLENETKMWWGVQNYAGTYYVVYNYTESTAPYGLLFLNAYIDRAVVLVINGTVHYGLSHPAVVPAVETVRNMYNIHVRLKNVTVYTVFVYDVEKQRSFTILALPAIFGLAYYYDDYWYTPHCAVFKASNGTHWLGAVSFASATFNSIDFYDTQVATFTAHGLFIVVRNNSSKYAVAAVVDTARGLSFDAAAIPPGGEAYLALPATSATLAIGNNCTKYVVANVYHGLVYTFNGTAVRQAGAGDLSSFLEYINTLVKMMSQWYNETLSLFKMLANASTPPRFSMPYQQQIATAVTSSSKTAIQSVTSYSLVQIASKAVAIADGAFGVVFPTIAGYSLGVLMAFAAAFALSRNREDPGDRLAAMAAIFLPVAVLLSVFFQVDVFQAAAIAAAMLALSYALNAGRL